MTEKKCSVPLHVLYDAPYELVLSDSVYAKVVANNYYGTGPASAPGNGATIVMVPHPPVQLTNDGSITNS